jgi:divalent metal cation (Fe/Co/Zn/Cd) transporter
VARQTDSIALEADARHMRTDVVTSVGVAAGLGLVRLTGRAWLDPITALCVALLILYTGYKLGHEALLTPACRSRRKPPYSKCWRPIPAY